MRTINRLETAAARLLQKSLWSRSRINHGTSRIRRKCLYKIKKMISKIVDKINRIKRSVHDRQELWGIHPSKIAQTE